MKVFLFIRRSPVRPVIPVRTGTGWRAVFRAAGLLAALSFLLCKYSTGQIVCILCYEQNDSISTGVNNLLLNGGFETSNCTPGYIGDVYCPNSSFYSCDLPNWTCTGGGYSTYSCLFNSATGSSIIVEGTRAAYLGNWYCQTCSPLSDDTSCLSNIDCTVTGIPPGYPVNNPSYGGATGLSIEQTVNGLVSGNTYVLEFWAGGEQNSFDLWPGKGMFAVDVGFGDTLLRCNPTPNAGGIGTRYIIEFNAIAPSHTIKFTNWGHICSTCTELVIDDIRLYTIGELSSVVPSCGESSSISSSDTDVCEKFCVDFFDSSANNPISWQWIFPGGSPSSSTDQNPSAICYTVPGTYDVTLITTNANGNDTLTLDNYITVYATPPFPTIIQAGYLLTSSPASSYQWQFNSADIPGATNQSYTILQSGYYTVIVWDSNGCKNSFTQYCLISGIGDAANDMNISIYPNPSSGNLTMELLNEMSAGEISIGVMNVIGQKVFSSSEKISPSSFKKEIDLTHVAAGVYYITLQSENIFFIKEVMIAR